MMETMGMTNHLGQESCDGAVFGGLAFSRDVNRPVNQRTNQGPVGVAPLPRPACDQFIDGGFVLGLELFEGRHVRILGVSSDEMQGSSESGVSWL
jgi:hypothetical protein